MLLSKITTNPGRFQCRLTPFSETTVAAIVAEGIDLAKFDPIPLIPVEDGRYCVAGDGHSRFEAIFRLFKANRLPIQWRDAKDFEIPARIVDADEARRLSWTANLSRDNFTACEEARVFQAMLNDGFDLDAVAGMAHKSIAYIQKTLPLNVLCRDIQVMIGQPEDAGGVDKYIAQAMAERFQRYSVSTLQQQELWHKVFKRVGLTSPFVRAIIDRIGPEIAKAESLGMLFAMPASVDHAVEQMKERASQLRRAERGLSWLMGVKDTGVLDDQPELKAFLDQHGKHALAGIKAQTSGDAEIIGNLFAAA